MPISEKRARADYVIMTDTLENVRDQIKHILADIRSQLTNA